MHSLDVSSQRVLALCEGELRSLELPGADLPVFERGPVWGDASLPLTPAYWAAQSWMWQIDAPDHFRLGRSLAEELLACMLGGYGIPAEVGLAAYDRLRAELLQCGSLADAARVEQLLTAPLDVNGRSVLYRFARQKADYVAAAFARLPEIEDDLDDRGLRDRLTGLRGVGPKTASWVVRNLRASDCVAILDVHILRIGRGLGIFAPGLAVERHYSALEEAFLGFADAIGARASILDSVMWMTVRQLPAGPSARSARTATRRPSAPQPQLAF